MKTLLLILGVVAFVYLEPAYSLICASCPSLKCVWTPNVQCEEGFTQCFKKWTGSEGLRTRYERGCAANCSTVTGKEKVMYCATDNCNN
nr:three-finger toxin [Pseudocerastes urarachnoides]